MTQLDKNNLIVVIDKATPKQLAALVGIYWRVRRNWEESETNLGYSHLDIYTYNQWLDVARPQFDNGTVFLAYYNMIMGIEPDGYCHT